MNYDNFIDSEKLFDAIEDRNPKKVQELINSGCDVNRSYSEDEITPLMYTAFVGDLAIAKLLVEAGADVNAVSRDGDSALLSSIFGNHKEIFQYLEPLTNIQIRLAVKKYIKTGKDDPPHVHEMIDIFTEEALTGNLESVSFILSKGININISDSSGETALLAAIRNKKDDVVQFLLKARANPNIKEQDQRGRTPLIAALEQGSEIAFQMLLEAGADINESSNYGETALMSAVWGTDLAAVRKLLQMGVDTKLKDEDGRTALDKARMFVEQFPEDAKAKEILKLLDRADS
jgi:ankyrin repeat protein